MLREEQIDLRRQRGVEGKFRIQNLGRNRVFSDYQVTNPASGGVYRVSVRGFELGDNSCTCPDFRKNTLGTCKHIEAVLAVLQSETPATLRSRKAAVTRPEVYLHYGEQLRPGIHLPPRCSDQLRELAAKFFDSRGLWKPAGWYGDLVAALETVPEDVTIFSDAMEFMEREIERREMAEREAQLVRQLEEGRLRLDVLRATLYPYQVRGALFAAYRGRCILGDDMGLGKTVQTLAAAELLVRERGIERVLVVAPASVKYQWEGEIRKFTDRPVQVIEGDQEARRQQYARPTFYRLINYELVLRDLEALNAWHADLIVLDEAQRIKNWESKISRAVKKLRSRYAIVLTGTPLENKLEELYSIVEFVDDRRLGPAFQFLHDHRVVDDKGKLLGYRNLDRLREKLAPIFLRRTRAEVRSQLPERTDTTVFVEMTPAQRGPYAEQQYTLARLVNKKFLTEVDRRRILCCIANMRMLCDSTFLYDKTTHVSPKLDELAELLPELLAPSPPLLSPIRMGERGEERTPLAPEAEAGGERQLSSPPSAGERGRGEGVRKIVIFSQWEVMLHQTAALLDRLGIGYTMLHGGVPTRRRRELLEKFRSDPGCRVFLSTDAGGTGLNLQAADTVINLEIPWNPAVLEQRIARVHRLGQDRSVQVINLVTRDSIEERVQKTVEVKRSLFEGLFTEGTDEVSFAALGRQVFLDAVREMVAGAEQLPPAPEAADPRQALVLAGVQLLEALAAIVSGPAGSNGQGPRLTKDAEGKPVLQVPLPSPEVLQRGAAALQTVLQGLMKPPMNAEKKGEN